MSYGFIYRNRWFMAIVVLPTLLAAIYYGLIASDLYASESRFVVKNQSDKPNSASTLASLIQTTGMASGEQQTNEVLDYIQSRNALADLEKRYPIKRAFSSPDADRFAQYPGIWSDDHFENLYRFYDGKVTTHIDTKTGLAVLEVRAFTAQDAFAINSSLLDLSEQLVNRLNVKANQNGIDEEEGRVALAEARARRARVLMSEYRNREDLLDPSKQATGVLEIGDKLVSERASLQTQLDVVRRLTPDSPSIAALEGQVVAIGKQIELQTARAVGTPTAISSKLANYENLMADQDFSSQALTAANASLEQARAEAARQQYYLERVVEPNKPDLARLPRRFIQILTVFSVSLCLYLIAWMLVVGILEHAPEE